MNKEPTMNKAGGPAFPTGAINKNGVREDGMSLRDWFAGMAMQGMASAPDNWNHKDIPPLAFDIADAMLQEREK
jgi:hypothetical protein